MKIQSYFRVAILMAVAAFAIACTKERIFKVEGQLDGQTPEKVTLERLSDDGDWIEVANTTPDNSGKFNLGFAAPDYPDLYRIAVNGKYVYLPVDSTETFSLKASAADISRGFKLSGSPQADAMTAFEAEAQRIEALNNPDSVQNFKRRVYDRWLKEAKANIFSYYVLTRKMGDGYFIDYTDPVYRAVATSFSTYKPNDPHTPLLAENARLGIGADRRRKGKSTTVEAQLTGIIDIKLPDMQGDTVALSSVVGKGKPAVLVFSGLTMPEAGSINMELRKLYDAGKINLYNVCLDADRFAWKRTAANLPWITVLDTDGLYSRAAVSYNLSALPFFFIFDAQGDLVNSTADIKALSSLIP